MKTWRRKWLGVSLALAGLASSPALAQNCDFLVPNQHGDGTTWAQSILPKFSSGSAELGFLDLGPPGPPGITGLQGAWLEWTPNNVYAGLMGGGLSSADVTQPPGVGMPPITSCLGAATLNGGWILTSSGAGGIVGVRPCTGAFLWTPTKLYLFALGGGISVVEVLDPALVPIPNVQGVCVLHSFVADYSITSCVVAAAVRVSALVYTPTKVYHVFAILSGGIVYTTTEVFTPAGLSIAKTRGIVTVAGAPDTGASPPVDIQGAAVLWNDAKTYLVTKTPLIGTTEIFDTAGNSIVQTWGVMKFGAGSTQPIRTAAQIWQQNQAWVVTIDPLMTVAEATQPPGTPIDPPIQSNVIMPAGPPAQIIERQASNLYEILGSMLAGGLLIRATIIGHNQRGP